MNRQWLYPYYFIGFLLLVIVLFGCDSEETPSFSVTVNVENAEGRPVQGASVGVRPCYDVGGEVACGAKEVIDRSWSTQKAKAVELTDWTVEVDDRGAVLTWTTASETNNVGFEIQQKVGEEETFEQIAFVDGQGTTSSTTDYRYRVALSYARYTFRLVAVSTSGNESVVGEPQTVRLSIDPGIRPIFPNPLRDRTTMGARVDTVSIFRSTAHTLDGASVQTVVEDTVERGIHRFFWAAEALPPGVYEQRTQIETGGEVVVRDTTYAVLVRDALEAASLGETDADGTVSTTERVRFPALYDVPPIEVRDTEAIVRGAIEVSPTVEFVVTTDAGVETVRRTVAEGENMLTLTVTP